MSRLSAEEIQLQDPWQKIGHSATADKSVYSQSPGAELDGRFDQMAQAGTTFSHSANDLCEPELHSSGLVTINQSRRYQELTFTAGRTVPYIVNQFGEKLVLASHASGTSQMPNSLPSGWSQGEMQLADDWRITFEGVVKTVTTVDGTKVYQGPVLLPGEVAPEQRVPGFTHKMIKRLGAGPVPQLAYECAACTFDQLASIDPPPGWSRGPTQVVLATGELRSTPCGVPSSVDFLPEMPGNEYQLIARPLTVTLVEVTPQGPYLINEVERDTVLRFPAGRRVHELTAPDGDVYVLFAYGVGSMDEALLPDFNSSDVLAGYPMPTGWTYSSRILESELVLESTGTVSVLAYRGSAPDSTWEKR